MKVNLSIFNSKKSSAFLTKLAVFVLLLLVVDLLVGALIGSLYRNAPYGANWTKENWLLQERFDIVILGSSRALRHYIPEVIEEKTGLSVFNAGQNGQYLLYAYTLEQLLLSRYAPGIIVLDVLPSFIIKTDKTGEEFDRLATLSPFIDNGEVRAMLTRGSMFEGLKYASHMYRYNSKILSILENYRSHPENVDNGYEVIGDSRYFDRNPFILDTVQHVEIDSFKLSLLHKFIMDAKGRNVKVVASFSPVSRPVSSRVDSVLQIYGDIFNQHNVPFINFAASEFNHYHNLDWFIDIIHMDGLGAEQFSRDFADRLLNIQDNKSVLAKCDQHL